MNKPIGSLIVGVAALAVIAALLAGVCGNNAKDADDGSLGQSLIRHKNESAGRKKHAPGAPNLYRGEQPTGEGFENLAKMGIQIDVDLRLSEQGAERKRVTSLGMQYVSIAWWCPTPKDEAFAKFLQLLRDNPNKKIFVHCRTGDDRVAMDIAAYRMVEQGWTAEQARQEMVADGANWLHRAICAGTVQYEKEIPAAL